MKHPSDLSAQTSFIGLSEDDKRWTAERKRKRAPKRETPRDLPNAPCCGRCANWRDPLEWDEFGHCRKLVTVAERVTRGPEKGMTLAVEDVLRGVEFEWEFMRTRRFFLGCSRFAEVVAEEAA